MKRTINRGLDESQNAMHKRQRKRIKIRIGCRQNHGSHPNQDPRPRSLRQDYP